MIIFRHRIQEKISAVYSDRDLCVDTCLLQCKEHNLGTEIHAETVVLIKILRARELRRDELNPFLNKQSFKVFFLDNIPNTIFIPIAVVPFRSANIRHTHPFPNIVVITIP